MTDEDALSEARVERALTRMRSSAMGRRPEVAKDSETILALVEQLKWKNAALRSVAEKFRAWTETAPNTQEESDALHEATEALGAFDAGRA